MNYKNKQTQSVWVTASVVWTATAFFFGSPVVLRRICANSFFLALRFNFSVSSFLFSGHLLPSFFRHSCLSWTVGYWPLYRYLSHAHWRQRQRKDQLQAFQSYILISLARGIITTIINNTSNIFLSWKSVIWRHTLLQYFLGTTAVMHQKGFYYRDEAS